MTKTDDKTRRLGSAPIGPLFFRLALPAVFGQLVTLANNVIDRIWVGHIPGDGVLSLQAVGVSFPIQHIFISILMILVAGIGPTVSILLGKGRRDEAGAVSGACFGLSLVVNVVFALAIVIFAGPLVTAFGASGEALPFARSYLRTVAWGLPFSNMLLLLMSWFNAQGYVSNSVRLSFLCVGVNAVLDPILIFPCGLGVTGAAVATNAGAVVAFLCGVREARHDGRLVSFGVGDLVPRFRRWVPSALIGLSTGINAGLESLYLMFVNRSLQQYGGDRAVAAMSVFAVLNFTLVCLDLGLSMGAQPLVSYNYGTGDLGRVRKANRYFIGASFACSFVLWAAVMLFPEAVWGCFTSDRDLIGYASAQTHLFFAFLLLTGIQYAHLYIARFLGQVRMSIFLGVLKRLFLLLPLIFILPAVLPGDKARSVLMAGPVTDLLAFLVTAACYFRIMRNLRTKEET